MSKSRFFALTAFAGAACALLAFNLAIPSRETSTRAVGPDVEARTASAQAVKTVTNADGDAAPATSGVATSSVADHSNVTDWTGPGWRGLRAAPAPVESRS